ncbi:hypothetical protein [Pseudoxanthomonas sp. LARHCG66]
MRTFLLSILLIPAAASAGQVDSSKYSSLAFEVLLNDQVLKGATLTASDQPQLYRSGTDRGTLRMSCADRRQTLSSVSLFEGALVQFARQGDQITMQVRESKIESRDDQILRVPSGQCQDLAATERVLVDRSFTIPADTAGKWVSVEIGNGYSVRAVTQHMKHASSP